MSQRIGQKMNLDRDWKFFLGNLAPQNETDGWGGAKARAYSFGATAADLDDSKWRSVTLPHDFVMEGDYTRKNAGKADMQKIPEMESIDSRHFAGGSLEGGIAWYRKRFTLADVAADKRVFLHFGGVYRNCTVYLNEYLVGSHKSGYTGFSRDITDFVNFGGENVLAVRVDATGREGWWYEGGGIYRHVWLEVKEAVYIEESGVFVQSEVDYENKKATLHISTEVANRTIAEQTVTVESVIKDGDGAVVGSNRTTVTVPVWENAISRFDAELEQVTLWDLENPYLYSVETRLYSCKGITDSTLEKAEAMRSDAEETMSDTVSTTFGLRHTYFDANRGFFLNGKKVRIQGLCCHHDHAGVGIAATDDIIRYRLQKMKEMGMNAYRSAHHPPAAELLDDCDRMGILVFDEVRRMSSNREDLEALRYMVKRDRNHPSVFLWGIGNEEIFSQDRPETARTTVTMRMEVRKLDPTRPITSAVVCWNGKERFTHARNYLGVTGELDVMGFNYCKTAWDDYHEVRPEQPVIITEASSNSWTRGCYETNEELGQYFVFDAENATKCKSGKKAERADMGESEWKYFAEREYLAGIFLWTGFDYRGEPTPLAYPAVYTQFGILDTCGFEKDNFYYYQSWWQEKPVLHLFPYWNFGGREGQALNVYCYSNLDEVELFVNGKSYGRKTMEKNWYLSWDNVIYEPGTLSAKGYRDGVEVLSEKVETTGTPYALQMEVKNTCNDSVGTIIIKVSVTDEQGRVVPTADDEILFEVSGVGEFLGCGNGNPGDRDSDKKPHRRAFNGLCQLLVRTTGEAGVVKVTARAKNLLGASAEIKVN